jgi:hypothetical protein
VEKDQWVAFKQALNQYNAHNTAAVKNEEAIGISFNKVLQHLQKLNRYRQTKATSFSPVQSQMVAE